MSGDYSNPFDIPVPSFVAIRATSQMLAARSHCHLLSHQPEAALADVTLLHQFNRLLNGPAEGRPQPLMASMIEVSIVGLYASAIAEGLQDRAWDRSQIIALQGQLDEIDLLAVVIKGLRYEQVFGVTAMQNNDPVRLARFLDHSESIKWRLVPRGWACQNMAFHARTMEEAIAEFQAGWGSWTNTHSLWENMDQISWRAPYRFMAAVSVPNCIRAERITDQNQTEVIQARVACALEMFRFDHGQYPDSLAELKPKYLAQIPHGLFETGPPAYHANADGSFTLSCHGPEKGPLLWPPK